MRAFLRTLLFMLVLLIAAAVSLAQVEAVTRVGVTVGDMDQSLAFYTRVLDFQVVNDREVVGEAWERLTGVFGLRCRIVVLRLGNEQIELTEYLASPGRPVPPQSRSNDRWFQHIAIITTDMDAAYARLRAHKVRHASTGPQTLPHTIPNAAGIRAFYFHDPDGHVLEVLEFPGDKGDARWHPAETDPPLFLGIDHTAVVVADTDASLRFYRDALGLDVGGGSENFGNEQAHLNNIRDAHLRITTLRAARGPGVELLEYLNPTDGRAYPADARPNDLFHWHTVLRVPELTRTYDDLRAHGTEAISDAPIHVENADAFICRDPDGHAILLHRAEPHDDM